MTTSELIAQVYDPELDPSLRDKPCALCGYTFRAGQVYVRCNLCDAPHHLDCWNYNGSKCTTFECRGRGRVADPAQGALKRLQDAIRTDSDVEIARAWHLGRKLLTKEQRSQYRERSQLAERRNEALQGLESALHTEDDRIIRDSYDDTLLDGCRDVTAEQRNRVDLASRRIRAIEDLDKALERGALGPIASAYDPDLLAGCSELSQQDHNTFAAIREASAQLEEAVQSNSDLAILEAWEAHQDVLDRFELTVSQVTRLQGAKQIGPAIRLFLATLASDDDRRISESYDARLLGESGDITAEQRARAELAQRRLRALDALAEALGQGILAEVAEAYDPDLFQGSSALTDSQRLELERIQAASNQLDQALAGDSDLQILEVWKGYQDVFGKFALPELQTSRIRLSQRRGKALHVFRLALEGGEDASIVESYDANLLDECQDITPDERAQLEHAGERVNALRQLRASITSNDLEGVYDLYAEHKGWIAQAPLSDEERTQIDRARSYALHTSLQRAIAAGESAEVADLGELLLLEGLRPTKEERRSLNAARRRLDALGDMKQAIATDDDRQIHSVYESWLRDYFSELSPENLRRIDLAVERVRVWSRLSSALKTKDARKVLQILAQHRDTPSFFEGSSLFNSERFRYQQWQDWSNALQVLQAAFHGSDGLGVVRAYEQCVAWEPRIDARGRITDAMLSISQQRQVRAAWSLQAMRSATEPISVINAAEEAIASGAQLCDQDRERLLGAWRITKFQSALAKGDENHVAQLLAEHDLLQDPALADAERRAGLRDFGNVGTLARLRRALISDDDVRIRNVYDPRRRDSYASLTPGEEQRLQQALGGR